MTNDANSAGSPPSAAKSSSKDDAAKETQRKNEEMANARLAFQQYGSERFEKTFWRFVAMDHPDSICLKFLRARKWNPSAVRVLFSLFSLDSKASGCSLRRMGWTGLTVFLNFYPSFTSLSPCPARFLASRAWPCLHVSMLLSLSANTLITVPIPPLRSAPPPSLHEMANRVWGRRHLYKGRRGSPTRRRFPPTDDIREMLSPRNGQA